jgi:nucleoside phosphorylase
MPTTDFLIVTALDEEREAVLRHFSMEPCPASEDDVRFYYKGRIASRDCAYSLALVPLLGMGRVEAANATSDAIRRWSPRYVVLVGIAGGVRAKGVALGDILVSNQVVDYELQKKRESGSEYRWFSHPADPRLLGAARNLPTSAWQGAIAETRPGAGQPSRQLGPIATGDKVVASEEFLKELQTHYPALIGVEMEAGGAAAAAFQAASKPGFFMVRAVSDLADPAKDSPQVQGWRAYACDAAAAFVAALIKSSPVPVQKIDQGPREGNTTSGPAIHPAGIKSVAATARGIIVAKDGYPIQEALRDGGAAEGDLQSALGRDEERGRVGTAAAPGVSTCEAQAFHGPEERDTGNVAEAISFQRILNRGSQWREDAPVLITTDFRIYRRSQEAAQLQLTVAFLDHHLMRGTVVQTSLRVGCTSAEIQLSAEGAEFTAWTPEAEGQIAAVRVSPSVLAWSVRHERHDNQAPEILLGNRQLSASFSPPFPVRVRSTARPHNRVVYDDCDRPLGRLASLALLAKLLAAGEHLPDTNGVEETIVVNAAAVVASRE